MFRSPEFEVYFIVSKTLCSKTNYVFYKSHSSQTQSSQLSAIPFDQWSRYYSSMANSRLEEDEVQGLNIGVFTYLRNINK